MNITQWNVHIKTKSGNYNEFDQNLWDAMSAAEDIVRSLPDGEFLEMIVTIDTEPDNN